MRLDLFLYERGYARSRTEAKELIEEGAVTVSGKTVTKASFPVLGDESITVDRSARRFASRGGEKLDFALEHFKISVAGKSAIDIGASSGGFTDCLLQHGVDHVIALDAGSGQLIDRIRTDTRVTVLENCNARYIKAGDFEYTPSLAVMDVSFISATNIIPGVYDVLADGGEFILLVKPQFEVGRAFVGKGGIVKDVKAREMAVSRVIGFAEQVGFICLGQVRSPITGGDGNVEYLAYFKKDNSNV